MYLSVPMCVKSILLSIILFTAASSIAQINCDELKSSVVDDDIRDVIDENFRAIMQCYKLDSIDTYFIRKYGLKIALAIENKRWENANFTPVTINDVYKVLDSIIYKSKYYDTLRKRWLPEMQLMYMPADISDVKLRKALVGEGLGDIESLVIEYRSKSNRRFKNISQLLHYFEEDMQLDQALSTKDVKHIKASLKKEGISCNGDFILFNNELPFYTNLKDAKICAEVLEKPLLIYFTGYAVVNSKKMDEQVLTIQKVIEYINQNYVMVWLFVDNRSNLPDEEIEKKELNGKEIIIDTEGKKWLYLEQSKFNTQTQPLFVITDTNLNQLGESIGFTPHIEQFLNWLNAEKH